VPVRLMTKRRPPSTDRREVFRGRPTTATGRISIGDADSDVVHPAHKGWNELVVTVASDIVVSDTHHKNSGSTYCRRLARYQT
jgi:hypothetical protein